MLPNRRWSISSSNLPCGDRHHQQVTDLMDSDKEYESTVIQSAVLARIRERAPSVHCIINEAALPITANVLLAVGATPSFSFDSHDLYSFVESSDALSINLGMLMGIKRRAIRNAAVYITHFRKPWVLDPTLINRSASRTRFCREILEFNPSAIRGNTHEIKTLCKITRKSVTELSTDHSTVVIETGVADRICGSDRRSELVAGHRRMTSVTGIGCALSALTAAALSVSEDTFDCACEIVQCYGDVGVQAAKQSRGPGTFVGYFLDGLYNASKS